VERWNARSNTAEAGGNNGKQKTGARGTDGNRLKRKLHNNCERFMAARAEPKESKPHNAAGRRTKLTLVDDGMVFWLW